MKTAPAYHASLVTQYPLIHQGKVRDSFAIDDEHMMIVASDRLSAFDVVMDDPIPGKGEILTRIANFWFEKTTEIYTNTESSAASDVYKRQGHDHHVVVVNRKTVADLALVDQRVLGDEAGVVGGGHVFLFRFQVASGARFNSGCLLGVGA